MRLVHRSLRILALVLGLALPLAGLAGDNGSLDLASAPCQAQLQVPWADGVSQAACCRVCTVGKPCGDSCIARNKTCHKGPGCACFAPQGDSEGDGLTDL